MTHAALQDVLRVTPETSYESVTSDVADIVLDRGPRKGLMFGLLVGFLLLNVLLAAIGWLFAFGVGVWGINIPVGWGVAIVHFVWWIGIGQAGTLISAILLLLHQNWRTSINRVAEAMTLFAVACAGLFPLLHLGRPQFFYWLAPYPATTGVWPNFRSPLIWDFFAVSTYGTVSLLFWYLGMIPDLATMRDRAQSGWAAKTYGVLSLGWRGSAQHWLHYNKTYLILAALATPLVVSVHTTVSWDFSVGIVPAWHSTVFPPYFVAGAIFCGFAMVLVITIPMRRLYGLKDLITAKHLDNMAKVMLAVGLGGFLRISDGCLDGVVSQRTLRQLYLHEPVLGSVCVVVLGIDRLQLHRASTAVVSVLSQTNDLVVRDRIVHQCRHVAGTVCHHLGQFAS